MSAEVLFSAMIDFLHGIEDVNTEMNPDTRVELVIANVGKGCFWFDVAGAIISASQSNLLTSGQNIGKVLSVFNETLKLAKHLDGDEPKSLEEKKDGTTVTSIHGHQLTISPITSKVFGIGNKVTNNFHVHISEALSKTNSDRSIEAISVENEDETVEISREQFEKLSKINLPVSKVEEEQEKTLVRNAQLVIVTVPLGGGLDWKWQFRYAERVIWAQIGDLKWLERFEQGEEQFRKGDKLIVDMDIYYQIDAESNLKKPKEHKITKVVQHIRRPEQDGML